MSGIYTYLTENEWAKIPALALKPRSFILLICFQSILPHPWLPLSLEKKQRAQERRFEKAAAKKRKGGSARAGGGGMGGLLKRQFIQNVAEFSHKKSKKEK